MAPIAPGAHKDSSFACENTMAKRSHHAKGSLVLKDYAVVKIDVCSIGDNPMQPKGRCEDVEELFESILATKTLVPIIVVRDAEVPNRYIACNGHRRLTVAREAGLKEIPAIIATGSPIELWAKHNAGAQHVSGNQWWNAWANCSIPNREVALREMPKKSARRLRRIEALLGTDMSQKFGMTAEHSPSCVDSVTRFVNGMTAKGVSVPMADALRWALTFNMIKKITSMIKFKDALTTPLSKAFAKAITENYGVNIEMNNGKFVIVPTVPPAPVDRTDTTLLDTIVDSAFDQDAQEQYASV